MFQYKGQTLCFKNWIASNILYVKDVFNENGVFKSLQEFSDILSNRSNWLCEYNIIRNVIKKKSILFDMKCCVFTRTDFVNTFNFHNGVHCILEKKCNFYYENMLSRKFKPPCHQSYLGRNYCVNKEYWPSIYTNKIKNMYDKRLSEFNYKLLNNILCTNSFLQKCKLRQNAECDYCDISNKDIKHLIFDCDNVKQVWHNLNNALKFIVKWKHVVIGFYVETNPEVLFYNTIISYIAFKIYKFKMGCRIKNECQDGLKLKQFVKNSLYMDMDNMLDFLKMKSMFKNTVKRLTNLL